MDPGQIQVSLSKKSLKSWFLHDISQFLNIGNELLLFFPSKHSAGQMKQLPRPGGAHPVPYALQICFSICCVLGPMLSFEYAWHAPGDGAGRGCSLYAQE
jgi:hypothetical protein